MIGSRLLIVTFCAAGLVAAGCGSGAASGNQSGNQGGTGNSGNADSTDNTGSTGKTATMPPARVQECATRTYQRMTASERVGQLFLVGMPIQAGLDGELTSAIRTYHFGSALIVGDTTSGVENIRSITDAVQRLATATTRLFIAANQEGGQIQPLRGPGFAVIPPATVQGTMPDLQQQARDWGTELKQAGVNLNLAPVLDVVPAKTASTNAPIGQLDREYGNDPGTVESHGVAFIAGMKQAGISTTAKHFPGLGRVLGNTDFTANVVDTVTEKNDPYLKPYQKAIDAGVPFVMVALATYTRIDGTNLAAFSTRIVTGLLRQRMGFNGVIVSDDLGAAAVANFTPEERAIAFLDAGGDMITEQSDSVAEQMAVAVRTKSAADKTFRNRVADAVMKILAAKAEYGLLAC